MHDLADEFCQIPSQVQQVGIASIGHQDEPELEHYDGSNQDVSASIDCGEEQHKEQALPGLDSG